MRMSEDDEDDDEEDDDEDACRERHGRIGMTMRCSFFTAGGVAICLSSGDDGRVPSGIETRDDVERDARDDRGEL